VDVSEANRGDLNDSEETKAVSQDGWQIMQFLVRVALLRRVVWLDADGRVSPLFP